MTKNDLESRVLAKAIAEFEYAMSMDDISVLEKLATGYGVCYIHSIVVELIEDPTKDITVVCGMDDDYLQMMADMLGKDIYYYDESQMLSDIIGDYAYSLWHIVTKDYNKGEFLLEDCKVFKPTKVEEEAA